jgi:hypothetical protein
VKLKGGVQADACTRSVSLRRREVKRHYPPKGSQVTVYDKSLALDQLRHKRNAYILTLASMRLLNSTCLETLKDRIVLIKPDGFIFDPLPEEREGERYEVQFNQILHSYINDNENFNVDLLELYKFSRRNLIKESFEVVKSYAGENNLTKQLKSQPWFEFARMVRNAVSHDLVWYFRPDDLKKLPVTWGGKTIDSSLNRKVLTTDFTDPLVTFELLEEIQKFIVSA